MQTQAVNPHRRMNYRPDSAPKYIEVIAEAGNIGELALAAPLNQSIYGGGINEGYEIPLPRKPPRRKMAEANQSFSASSQSSHSPAPEYGLPSPRYWNVDVSSVGSSSSNNFKRSNSTSSNLPLLHRSNSGGGGGGGPSALMSTTETRNQAFIEDSLEDVQYTAVTCPDYQLHLAQTFLHPLDPLYHHHGDNGDILESDAVANMCSVARVASSPSSGSGGDSSSTAGNSPVYTYTYRSIPAGTSTSGFPQNMDYHRHNHNLNSPQVFGRQTIDTCGSG